MDRLIKAFAFDGQVRLIAVESTNIVNRALKIHDLSPTTTGALGRFLTAGALMGSMLKNDTDRLTLIMKGSGPIGNMVVCSNDKAVVKGYAQNPHANLPLNSLGKLDVGGVVGKMGYMNVIKDIGLKEPYSGQVEIVSGEIGDEIARYYAESEQIPSVVAVGVQISKTGKVSYAGGYILQLMPGTDDAIIDMIEGRIRNIKPMTALLKEGFSLEEVLKSISGDEDINILEEVTPEFKCDCSRERMKMAVATMNEKERKEIIDKEGFIEVKCSFCGKSERYC